MSKEQYDDIIKHAKESLEKNILDKITDFRYSEIDDYFVIQVYVKEGMKARNLGEILSNIEDYAREQNISVVVDFLRG
ncbi:MAG: hypothetical protein E7J99_11420 [Clostridium butyricum]|jgi:flagellar biosynthesis component FlhA|uniref:Uncharacterized protein n=1 Tax=Clostridium butyricum TaxID=1492 RepID=A0A6L9EN67_CLOBU|nr:MULTISPECIES: hypothetical protein [Clostridium]MDU1116760.1 hypothetical protein [Clostridium sp.]MDU7712755.1 hypothetical protein [Clostridium butyricum]NAS18127.1 hypothetical protein [Clostridium butyricum]